MNCSYNLHETRLHSTGIHCPLTTRGGSATVIRKHCKPTQRGDALQINAELWTSARGCSWQDRQYWSKHWLELWMNEYCIHIGTVARRERPKIVAEDREWVCDCAVLGEETVRRFGKRTLQWWGSGNSPNHSKSLYIFSALLETITWAILNHKNLLIRGGTEQNAESSSQEVRG